jgi:citrate synthase
MKFTEHTDNPPADYVSRNEALRTLRIKPQTLYAYVSRGLIRRQRGPDGRQSLYNRHDIAGIRAKSIARSGHGPAAASAAHWGEPLLVSGITEITAQGPRYRDHLALDLARAGTTFESLAQYLWTGALKPVARWPSPRQIPEVVATLTEIFRRHPDMHVRQLMAEFVLLFAIENDDGDPGEIAHRAQDLLVGMAGVFGFLGGGKAYVASDKPQPVADLVMRGLGIAPAGAKRRMLDAALVLVADHEFSPATFAARIAAASGSDLYACIATALQVHFGSEFGLRCDRVEQELGAVLAVKLAAGDWPQLLDRARTTYGFEHPLYRNGDPRARMLLDLALTAAHGGRRASRNQASEHSTYPLTLDEALVLFCQALGMPRGSAGALLAFGRMAGWVAHILEQRADGAVIRPRAKFIAPYAIRRPSAA